MMIEFKPGKYKSPIYLTDHPVSRFVKKLIMERHVILGKRTGKGSEDITGTTILLGKLIHQYTTVPKRESVGWARWFLSESVIELVDKIFPGPSNPHFKKYSEERREIEEMCRVEISNHVKRLL